MRCFTDNPLERVMMRIPQKGREEPPPAPPYGHVCYGCGRYGEACVLPCYRNVQAKDLRTKEKDATSL